MQNINVAAVRMDEKGMNMRNLKEELIGNGNCM